jgi:hypothetical protein
VPDKVAGEGAGITEALRREWANLRWGISRPGKMGFGFRILVFGFRVSGFGFRVLDFGFRVPGLAASMVCAGVYLTPTSIKFNRFVKLILFEPKPLLACSGLVTSQKWLVSRKFNLRNRLNLIDVGAEYLDLGAQANCVNVHLIRTRAQQKSLQKLLHAWITLVMVKQHLVKIGQIDVHAEYRPG